MKYIIHSNIIFDTTEYILTSLYDSNLSIKLSNSAGQILEELIKYRHSKSPVTREHLFEIVWKSHGLSPSHGNLNQQISLIRKTLGTFGLNSSSIITIPKRGLRLNNQLIIKNISEKSTHTDHTSFNYAVNQNNHNPLSNSIILSSRIYIKYITILTIILFFTFGTIVFYLHSKANNIKLYCCKEINSCNICSLPTISEPENNNDNVPYSEII